MNSNVVDASAVLALLQQEVGTEMLTPRLMSSSVIRSVINLAAVHTKLVLGGGEIELSWLHALATVNAIEPFTEAHAKIAGSLVKKNREYGVPWEIAHVLR